MTTDKKEISEIQEMINRFGFLSKEITRIANEYNCIWDEYQELTLTIGRLHEGRLAMSTDYLYRIDDLQQRAVVKHYINEYATLKEKYEALDQEFERHIDVQGALDYEVNVTDEEPLADVEEEGKDIE